MKRIVIGIGCALAVAAGGATLMAARFEETISPNTYVGMVHLGGLSREAARKKLRIWWETERRRELEVSVPHAKGKPILATPGKLGLTIDDAACIAKLPEDSFWDSVRRTLGGGAEERKVFEVQFQSNGADSTWLDQAVRATIGSPRPARVTFADGVLTRHAEVGGFVVDRERLPAEVVRALQEDGRLTVPIVEEPKRVPDEELEKITDVLAEFSTKFPVYEKSRNANLNIASQKIDGMVMMPGDEFSFNEVVGKRTMEEGFRLAPILLNGRHDTGIGGGICQVSSTLYNAVALAGLKITQRQNHSMPSTYISVGRDATVSYPALDLKFVNDAETPIAISRTYTPGKITFRILGQKVPGREIKFATEGHRSWPRGEKIEHDPSLPFGKKKVVEKGSRGHEITVYRLFYENGTLVKRELFNRSKYAGAPRIIAVNKLAKPPAAENLDGDPTPPADPIAP